MCGSILALHLVMVRFRAPKLNMVRFLVSHKLSQTCRSKLDLCREYDDAGKVLVHFSNSLRV